MAMTSVTHDIKSSTIYANTMFKAVILEASTTYITVFPQLIKTVETIQGDGGVGTIFKICFVDSVTTEVKTSEVKVETIDSVNLYAKYTMTEDDSQVVVNELKFETEGEGCICKLTNHYVKNAEGTHSGAERALRFYKMVLEYLSANPNACA